MKRNMFGDMVLQPGDDIGAAFNDSYDTDIEADLLARFIGFDESFGWTCVIEDPAGNEIEAHNFDSEEDLRSWLEAARVSIEEE